MSELSDAINEMRNMRESYNQIGAAAEAYNAGKVELAENITAKGIPASATETLPELAEKVGAIAQTQTILEGGEVMAAQQFGDGALWNLYQVLADMKTRFMGNGDYAALIVCEYYKGYDSLVLQGADGYFTCDGDYYDYASPTHVWHDADNGKMNRWVAFLYRQAGARLDITNTAISPRSMYIGGHIGTIEYFVNGRLTDFVCGVEETDVVDNTNFLSVSQQLGRVVVVKNIGNISSKMIFSEDNLCAIVIFNQSIIGNVGDGLVEVPANSNCDIKIQGVKKVAGNNYIFITRGRTENISMPDTEEFSARAWICINFNDTLRTLDFKSAKKINGQIISNIHSQTHLIDFIVGEMETSIYMYGWNPTNVLSDAAKKVQLIENIKNHILARVSDRTGLTQLVFAVSLNMYNNIASEQIEWQGETMSLADAFLTKNWLLAGA